MTDGLVHQISALSAKPGELSFDATIGGHEQRIWFRSESGFDPHPEAALAACTMPAMRAGGTLTVSEPLSPRTLRTQREFQAIQAGWSRSWPFGDPPLREVEVLAPSREPRPRTPTGRVAAFFSGGIDSWSTVLTEPEITDLVFVRGIDILTRAAHQEGLAERAEAELRAAADEVGLPLHVVDTNLRELAEPPGVATPLVRWETYYNSALAAVALFLGADFDRVLITGDFDYEVQVNFGASWTIDHLWGNEEMEIVDAGGRFSRIERTAIVAGSLAARKSLRVCWENPGGAYNCGHCRKCQMTAAMLEAVGGLEGVETLPSEIDLERLAKQEPPIREVLIFWEEALEAARQGEKPELERAVAELVTASRRRIGLPSGYRARRPRMPEPTAAGTLWATPETAAAIATAPALAILVGSYDGSGNYGDLAQLDAALGLLDGGPLALPIVECQFAATHETLGSQFAHPPRHVLYFDDGEAGDGGLVPVRRPDSLGLGLLYLYGGGYLNPSWGARKLAMLAAAEAMVGGAARVCKVASGQQVDRAWIAALDPAREETLREFELLGARDDASARALAELVGAERAPNTGDDAVGLLAGLIATSSPPQRNDTALEVNLHFGAHDWVTGSADAALEFDLGLLTELSRLAERPLRIRPLLAYVDPRVDERPGIEKLTAECAARGIEVGEPCLLRPVAMAGLADELGAADLTLSSSYHVALTSLLLGVPAVMPRDNDYYDQKARGLLGDFGLPEALSPTSTDDPAQVAAAIAPQLLETGRREELRRHLQQAGDSVRARRAGAESWLLGLLAREATAALGDSRPTPVPDEEETKPPEVSSEELAQRTEEAERRAAAAEAQLREVLGSHSWKLTAPLRRARARRRA
ncbi:MAG TPA: hypothetical protein VFX44_04150 [Solirubrobacterales bacterium]|nr:hypothetical protein [Solirubrobacterales bacterium]